MKNNRHLQILMAFIVVVVLATIVIIFPINTSELLERKVYPLTFPDACRPCRLSMKKERRLGYVAIVEAFASNPQDVTLRIRGCRRHRHHRRRRCQGLRLGCRRCLPKCRCQCPAGRCEGGGPAP